MADASAYQKLDHREHVLLRPGMYIGSVEPEVHSMWVMDPLMDKSAECVECVQCVDGVDGDSECGKSVDSIERVEGGVARMARMERMARMVRKDVSYVPGLYKVVDEILMNSVDHSVRLKRRSKAAAPFGLASLRTRT